MYKGIVFEINTDNIVVHCDDGRYLKLKKRGKVTVGSYIAFFEDDIIKARNRRYMAISVAAILIMAIILQPFMLPTKEVYAIVSLDTISSVEYEVDEKGVVLGVKPLNAQGELIAEKRFVGMSINDVIKTSINKSVKQGFIKDKDNDVLISETIVATGKVDYLVDEKALSVIKSDESIGNLYLVRTTEEVLDKAEDENVSAGKMYLASEVADRTQETVNDLLEKSVDELMENVENSIDELEELNEIRETIEGVHEELDELVNRYPYMQSTVDEVKDELYDVNDSLDDIDLPELEDMIDDIEEAIIEEIDAHEKGEDLDQEAFDDEDFDHEDYDYEDFDQLEQELMDFEEALIEAFENEAFEAENFDIEAFMDRFDFEVLNLEILKEEMGFDTLDFQTFLEVFESENAEFEDLLAFEEALIEVIEDEDFDREDFDLEAFIYQFDFEVLDPEDLIEEVRAGMFDLDTFLEDDEDPLDSSLHDVDDYVEGLENEIAELEQTILELEEEIESLNEEAESLEGDYLEQHNKLVIEMEEIIEDIHHEIDYIQEMIDHAHEEEED